MIILCTFCGSRFHPNETSCVQETITMIWFRRDRVTASFCLFAGLENVFSAERNSTGRQKPTISLHVVSPPHLYYCYTPLYWFTVECLVNVRTLGRTRVHFFPFFSLINPTMCVRRFSLTHYSVRVRTFFIRFRLRPSPGTQDLEGK